MSGERKVIAIDGPSASGKGTVAREVARRLGADYLDTGATYRAFALFADGRDVSPEDGGKVDALLKEAKISFLNNPGGYSVMLNGRDVSGMIRTPEISESASRFSEIGSVRDVLGRIQRAHGRNTSIVAEGRDMGTRVFYDADYKFFLTADPEERARRRNSEIKESGGSQTFEDTVEEMCVRDERDARRKLSPLKPADDAVIIDTTRLGVDEVVEIILNRVA
ncbi:MAG: (d)CMP kinase [Thermodesulfobacteriota bacterium]